MVLFVGQGGRQHFCSRLATGEHSQPRCEHSQLSTLTHRELPCGLYSLEQRHLLQRRYSQGILNDSNLLLFQAVTSS